MLMEHWTTLDHEYTIEEQELKHMLKTDNEKRIEKQKKNLYDDWENVLFGTTISTTEPRKDVNNFIMIRYVLISLFKYEIIFFFRKKIIIYISAWPGTNL